MTFTLLNINMMLTVVSFLIDHGYMGMFLSAILAGSVFPFSSEVVISALYVAGLSPLRLILSATVGNVLGGMFNYWIGSLGRMDWIERYLHVKKRDLDRAHRFVAGRGAWMAFFAFLPFIGSAITVLLGLMRANVPITVTSMALGKALRYALLIYGTQLFM